MSFIFLKIDVRSWPLQVGTICITSAFVSHAQYSFSLSTPIVCHVYTEFVCVARQAVKAAFFVHINLESWPSIRTVGPS